MPDINPLQLPFKEAIDFFKNKIQLPSSGWTDIWQEQHSHGLIISGASHDAIVEDFYNALKQSHEQGTGYAVFRENFDNIVTKHGWTHHGTAGWRSRIIYNTNITQSYNAGRWQQMMAVKDLRPFLQYQHTSIENPRLEHKAWDGITLPADDPWWNTHYVQNGWGCQCRIRSLTYTEAQRGWEAKGQTGPDKAPPIEWVEQVVGKTGSNPRTVLTPKGIDAGFAYNPGKAWLEPHTVPPLQGYDAVLKQRDKPWPTTFTPPKLPTPTIVHPDIVLPATTPPAEAVLDFLEVFGADMERGAVFEDAAGSAVAITKSLFIQGMDKTGDNFKWLAEAGKAERLQYINLLAMALIEPDEIWWNWEQDRQHNKDNPDQPSRWRLKRRYLRSFEIDGSGEYAVVVFEWGRTGWTGSTALMAQPSSEKARLKYFDKQRIGKLVYHK